jgi:hypothetical protein
MILGIKGKIKKLNDDGMFSINCSKESFSLAIYSGMKT